MHIFYASHFQTRLNIGFIMYVLTDRQYFMVTVSLYIVLCPSAFYQ